MPGYGESRGPRVGRGTKVAFLLVVLAATLLALEVLGPKSAGAVGNIEELYDHEPDRDFRAGRVAPSQAQQGAVDELGASVRWNDFGTPQALINYRGLLDTGVRGGNAGEAARSFLADNAAVFGVSAGYLSGGDTLEEVNVTPEGVLEVMKLFLDTKVSSLDAPGPGGDEPNLSAIKSLQYEAFSLPIEDRILLEQGMKSLSELQQKVVYLFFYKDLSQTEIGKRLGLPQRKVSRIIAAATKSLKERFTQRR